jgi:hypothetical protein
MQEGQPIQDLPTPLLYNLTLHALGLVDVPAYSAIPKADIERKKGAENASSASGSLTV